MSTRDALNALQSQAGAGDGRDLVINCPKCRTQGAKAVAYDLVESMDVVIRHRTTWIKCLACGAKLYSKRKAEDLAGLSAEQLEKIVVVRISLISKLFAVLSILTCIIPFFGLVVSIIATLLNYRHRGWLRWFSLVGLIISIIPTVLFLIPRGH